MWTRMYTSNGSVGFSNTFFWSFYNPKLTLGLTPRSRVDARHAAFTQHRHDREPAVAVGSRAIACAATVESSLSLPEDIEDESLIFNAFADMVL